MVIALLGEVAAGLRVALTLLAVMVLLTSGHWQPDAISPARRLKARRLNLAAWTLMAVAVIAYSPAHAASLMGYAVAPALNRALDALATGTACLAFIKVIPARGLMRGLSWSRVVRGMVVNNVMVAATVGAAWLTR